MRSTPGPGLFTNSISEPLGMHSILSISASHYLLKEGRREKIEVEFYKQKGTAIKLLKESLDDPSRRHRDGVLVAIGVQACHEVEYHAPLSFRFFWYL